MAHLRGPDWGLKVLPWPRLGATECEEGRASLYATVREADLALFQAKRGEDLPVHILSTGVGQDEIDTVQSHPIDFLLPPRPVPRPH